MRSRSRRRRSGAAADHLDICVIPKLVTLQPFIQEGQLSHLGGRGGQTGGAAKPLAPVHPSRGKGMRRSNLFSPRNLALRHATRTEPHAGAATRPELPPIIYAFYVVVPLLNIGQSINPLPSRLDWALDHLDRAARRMDSGNHSDSRRDKSPLPQLTIIAVLVSGDEPHAFTVGSGVLTQRVVATSSIRPPGPARHRCEWPSEPP
jgi:hypothetical protein